MVEARAFPVAVERAVEVILEKVRAVSNAFLPSTFSWLAITSGIEIIIAIEKDKAIITNEARFFLEKYF